MTEKLLPCPFCGGEAVLFGKEKVNWVSCRKCLADMKTSETKEQAIAAWNRRAQPENEAIVHCAECEHYTPSPMGGNGCLIRFNGRTEIIPRNPTDFCSHGERKPERSEG